MNLTLIMLEKEDITPESLKELLAKHNLTQQKVADDLEVFKQTVSRWMSTGHKISNVYKNVLIQYFNNLEDSEKKE
jgi:transcriptional regulator with XRE-family HTH domain